MRTECTRGCMHVHVAHNSTAVEIVIIMTSRHTCLFSMSTKLSAAGENAGYSCNWLHERFTRKKRISCERRILYYTLNHEHSLLFLKRGEKKKDHE